MPSHGEAEARNVRWIALWVTLVTFAIALLLTWRFDPKSADFQFEEKYRWLEGAIIYHMGVDGISLPFVVLTTGLMPMCIIASWRAIQQRVKEYAGSPSWCFRDPDGRHLQRRPIWCCSICSSKAYRHSDVPPHQRCVGRAAPAPTRAKQFFFLDSAARLWCQMLLAIMSLYWDARNAPISPAPGAPRLPARPAKRWFFRVFFASFRG